MKISFKETAEGMEVIPDGEPTFLLKNIRYEDLILMYTEEANAMLLKGEVATGKFYMGIAAQLKEQLAALLRTCTCAKCVPQKTVAKDVPIEYTSWKKGGLS